MAGFDISPLARRISENGEYSFTITPNAPLAAQTTIYWEIVRKGATPASLTKDFMGAISGSHTFSAGTTQGQPITINFNDDDIAEFQKSFEIRIYEGENSDGTLLAAEDVILEDNDGEVGANLPDITIGGNDNADILTAGGLADTTLAGGAGDDIYIISRFQYGDVSINDNAAITNNIIKFDVGVIITGFTEEENIIDITLNTGAVVRIASPSTKKLYQLGDNTLLEYEAFKTAISATDTNGDFTIPFTDGATDISFTPDANPDVRDIVIGGNDNDDIITAGGLADTTLEGLRGDDVYVISRFQYGDVFLRDTTGTVNVLKFDVGVIITGYKELGFTNAIMSRVNSVALTLNTGAVITIDSPAIDPWAFQLGDGALLDYAAFKTAIGATGTNDDSTLGADYQILQEGSPLILDLTPPIILQEETAYTQQVISTFRVENSNNVELIGDEGRGLFTLAQDTQNPSLWRVLLTTTGLDFEAGETTFPLRITASPTDSVFGTATRNIVVNVKNIFETPRLENTADESLALYAAIDSDTDIVLGRHFRIFEDDANIIVQENYRFTVRSEYYVNNVLTTEIANDDRFTAIISSNAAQGARGEYEFILKEGSTIEEGAYRLYLTAHRTDDFAIAGSSAELAQTIIIRQDTLPEFQSAPITIEIDENADGSSTPIMITTLLPLAMDADGHEIAYRLDTTDFRIVAVEETGIRIEYVGTGYDADNNPDPVSFMLIARANSRDTMLKINVDVQNLFDLPPVGSPPPERPYAHLLGSSVFPEDIDLSALFTDDGGVENLRYRLAPTNNPSALGITINGSTLSFGAINSGQTNGAYTITVIATDENGAGIEGEYQFTYFLNLSPTVSQNPTTQVSYTTGQAAREPIDLRTSFDDENVNALSFTLDTAEIGSGTSINGNFLEFGTGTLSLGTYSLLITAIDEFGATATHTITYTITEGEAIDDISQHTPIYPMDITNMVNGTSDDEVLVGNDDDNVINTNGGADVIIAGKGDDTINLGDGAEIIIYRFSSKDGDWEGSDGSEIINNFELGKDRIIFLDIDDTPSGVIGTTAEFLENAYANNVGLAPVFVDGSGDNIISGIELGFIRADLSVNTIRINYKDSITAFTDDTPTADGLRLLGGATSDYVVPNERQLNERARLTEFFNSADSALGFSVATRAYLDEEFENLPADIL